MSASLLIFFALVPWLWFATRSRSLGHSVVQSLWLSVIFGAVAYHWVTIGLINRFDLGRPEAVLYSLPYYFIHQPQFLIFAPLLAWWWNSVGKLRPIHTHLVGLIGLSFAYAALDAVLPKLLGDTLAHAFIGSKALAQAVDIGGPWLVTAAIMFTNLMVLTLVTSWRSFSHSTRAAFGLATLAPLACLWIYGVVRLETVEAAIARSSTFVSAVVVQGNLGARDPAESEGTRKQREFDEYMTLTLQARDRFPNADFIMWPETSYPGTFRGVQDHEADLRDQRMENFIREAKIPIAFGAFDVDNRSRELFNAMMILDPDGRIQIYRKTILLPGGEHWPILGSIPIVSRWLPKIRQFSRGPGAQILKLPTRGGTITVSPVICFESVFGEYVRAGAELGSQLILNATDDSWFGDSIEPLQHLRRAAFTSIEARLPQLRATGSGISALILPTGEIIEPTKPSVREVAAYHVPIMEPIPSLAMRWGNWFVPIAALLGAAMLFTTRRT